MPSRHAVLAPSASKRWLNCTPSARLESLEPESESVFAREGTLAHGLAEYLLNQLNDGYIKLDELDVYKDSDGMEEALSAIDREGFNAEEIWNYVVDGYVKPVFSLYMNLKEIMDDDARLLVETELQLGDFIPESFGSCDSCIIADGVFYVNDLKYGKGLKVDATWNSQMMCYALGAYAAHKPNANVIEMTIYQPRLSHIDSWSISIKQLLVWADTVLKPQAAKAFEGIGTLVAGDHCQFCKVKAHCPEQRALVTYADRKAADLQSLTPEQIAELLPLVPIARQHLDALEAYATQLIMSGGSLPGYKVVEGISRRKIEDQQACIDALVEAGFDLDMIMKSPELKNLSDLEKMMGKAGKAILAPYIVKPQGKPTLTTADDKRPPITNTQDMFNHLNNLLK